jgi:hypothetical protein
MYLEEEPKIIECTNDFHSHLEKIGNFPNSFFVPARFEWRFLPFLVVELERYQKDITKNIF